MLCQPGYGLVPLIERGDTHSPAVLELLRAYLLPMLEAGADTLVLGCTHYPFLQDAIREIAGDRLTLIDTGHAVARHLGRTLAAAHLQATGPPRPALPEHRGRAAAAGHGDRAAGRGADGTADRHRRHRRPAARFAPISNPQ